MPAAAAGHAQGRPPQPPRISALILSQSYQGSPGLALANTTRDAALMARSFQQLRFDSVTCRPTAARRRPWRGIAAYLRTVDANTIASLYVAGHGVEIGGENLLLLEGGDLLPEPAGAGPAAPAARRRHRPVPRRLPQQSVRQCRRRDRRAAPVPDDPGPGAGTTSGSRRSASTSCAPRPRDAGPAARLRAAGQRSRSSFRPIPPMSPSTAPGRAAATARSPRRSPAASASRSASTTSSRSPPATWSAPPGACNRPGRRARSTGRSSCPGAAAGCRRAYR